MLRLNQKILFAEVLVLDKTLRVSDFADKRSHDSLPDSLPDSYEHCFDDP